MLALWVLAVTSFWGSGLVNAQPSPQVQERISAAIKKAASLPADKVDYTEFVNVFIGTDNFGDVWYATVNCARNEERLNIHPYAVRVLLYHSAWFVASSTRMLVTIIDTLRRSQVKFSTDLTGYAPAGPSLLYPDLDVR